MRIARMHDNEERLDTALANLRAARAAKDQAEKKAKEAEREVIDLLHKTQQKSHECAEGDKRLRATVVYGERVKVDQKGLAEVVGQEFFDEHFTERKFSQEKLAEALQDDRLEAEVVAPFLTAVPNNPYIRFTEAPIEDAQG